MNRVKLLHAFVALGVAAGCNEAPTEPTQSRALSPQQHVSTRTCPLASLPASANVVLCFNAALVPGVWHGWFLERSDAQPPGTGGGLDFFDADRLNHDYVLASPTGYRRWGAPGDPIAPFLGLVENVYAFQPEWNGVVWNDVLRLHARQDQGPQTVPIVVFWAQPTAVGGDIVGAVDALLTADVVNGGQANALTRKIDHASDLIAKGKTAEAIEVLRGFIQQVNDLAAEGVLTPAQGEQLIAWAEYMIAFI